MKYVPEGSNSSSMSRNVFAWAIPFQSYLGCNRLFSVNSIFKRAAVSVHGPFSRNLAMRKYNSPLNEGGTDGVTLFEGFIFFIQFELKSLEIICLSMFHFCAFILFRLCVCPCPWTMECLPSGRMTEVAVQHHQNAIFFSLGHSSRLLMIDKVHWRLDI